MSWKVGIQPITTYTVPDSPPIPRCSTHSRRPRHDVGNTIAHLEDTAIADTPNLLTVGPGPAAARRWRAHHPLVGARRSLPGRARRPAGAVWLGYRVAPANRMMFLWR